MDTASKIEITPVQKAPGLTADSYVIHLSEQSVYPYGIKGLRYFIEGHKTLNIVLQ